MYIYKATILKIVDGDTLDLDIDLGFGIHRKQRVRLEGIDAPELKDSNKLAKEAAKESKKFLESLLPVGLQVQLVSTSYDKYGRVLGKIWTLNSSKEPDIEVNDQLIKFGYAKIY